MDTQEEVAATQWALANEEAGRLRQRHDLEGIPARALYAELLEYLDRYCPAVFLNLTGRGLYDLLKKGSQPVSGEALKHYRLQKSKTLPSSGFLPIPKEAHRVLAEGIETLWASSFAVARREAQDVADAKTHYLQEALAAIQEDRDALRASLAQAQERERDLLARQEADAHTLALQTAELGHQQGTLKQQAEALDALTQELAQERIARHEIQSNAEAQLHALTEEIAAARAAYEGLSARFLVEVDTLRQNEVRLSRALASKEKDLVTTLSELRTVEDALATSQVKQKALLAEVDRLKRMRKPTIAPRRGSLHG